MLSSSNQADIPTIDHGQPLTTAEYNQRFNALTDPATSRPSPTRIAVLSEQEKDAITHYLVGMKRPIIAGFVTANGGPALRAAGYEDGYHNPHFAFWIRPEHKPHFQRTPPDSADRHPIPRLATPDLPPVTRSSQPIFNGSSAPASIGVGELTNHLDEMVKELEHQPEPDPLPAGPEAIPTVSGPRNKTSPAELLAALLLREQALSEAATKEVVFSPPLISRHQTGIIGRGTVNIIQGAYGSHKSRLAETFGALMLNTDTDARFLEFARPALERFAVCYIDTERNQSEELPFAVQQIKLKACFRLSDRPEQFRFTSIKAIERKHRFAAIDAFISHVRESTSLHLFTLIDVVTDAIGDFNDSEETMKLFDFLGNMCDRHNATFLLVIHQNPGTDKARGHTGTEAANKASSVLQIGFEKDAGGNDSDLIRLRYLKLRRGKRPEPIYIRYCDQTKGLVLADAGQVAEHVSHRKYKADIDDMAERLTTLLSQGPVAKGEVVNTLMAEFAAGNRIIRERLKTIQEQGAEMYNEEGQAVKLNGYKDGKNEYYRLERTG